MKTDNVTAKLLLRVLEDPTAMIVLLVQSFSAVVTLDNSEVINLVEKLPEDALIPEASYSINNSGMVTVTFSSPIKQSF